MWDYGWMMGHGWWGGWFMPFGGFWLLILLVILFAVLLIRFPRHHGPPRPSRSLALDTLEQRYAKGEIGREEYLEKKRDLTGQD